MLGLMAANLSCSFIGPLENSGKTHLAMTSNLLLLGCPCSDLKESLSCAVQRVIQAAAI